MFLAGGFSSAAIDTARTSERLSAFLSRVIEKTPVDNISVDLPALNKFMERRKMIDGGRQSQVALDTSFNSTIDSFSDYDVFDTTPQDTARTAVFSYINYGGTVSISWEEMRETANDNVRIFNLLEHKRNNAIKAMKDRMNSDLLAAVVAGGDINSLPFLINTSETVGGIDSSTNSYWQSQESTAVGAFAANGLDQMRNVWNDIKRQGQGEPDLALTTQAVFEAYEAELEVDTRYSDPKKLSRGALELEWKGRPLMFDNDMPSGQLYYLNFDHIWLAVDTDGDFDLGPMIEPADQKAFVSKLVFRGQAVVTNRRALGRLTGIS